MISGSTANIKGAGTPVSMADHSLNTIISCFKPSDHPSATILVVTIDHNRDPAQKFQNSKTSQNLKV